MLTRPPDPLRCLWATCDRLGEIQMVQLNLNGKCDPLNLPHTRLTLTKPTFLPVVHSSVSLIMLALSEAGREIGSARAAAAALPSFLPTPTAAAPTATAAPPAVRRPPREERTEREGERAAASGSVADSASVERDRRCR